MTISYKYLVRAVYLQILANNVIFSVLFLHHFSKEK